MFCANKMHKKHVQLIRIKLGTWKLRNSSLIPFSICWASIFFKQTYIFKWIVLFTYTTAPWSITKFDWHLQQFRNYSASSSRDQTLPHILPDNFLKAFNSPNWNLVKFLPILEGICSSFLGGKKRSMGKMSRGRRSEVTEHHFSESYLIDSLTKN